MRKEREMGFRLVARPRSSALFYQREIASGSLEGYFPVAVFPKKDFTRPLLSHERGFYSIFRIICLCYEEICAYWRDSMAGTLAPFWGIRYCPNCLDSFRKGFSPVGSGAFLSPNLCLSGLLKESVLEKIRKQAVESF